jgi:gas vesicle protein
MKESTGKMFMGFLIGAAVGAAAGILFAPDKGTATRKKIAKKAKEAGDTVKDTVSEQFEDLKEFVSEKLGKMKKKVSDLEETVENAEKTADSKVKI